jgi:1-deoxy-D-xylulose-5-phosphate reductoisomerase
MIKLTGERTSERVVSGASALDFRQLAPMTFESLDANDHALRFPGLQLAWDSLRAPFGTCAVLNAANEMAVAAFLDHRIRFNDIHAVNQATLASVQFAVPDNLEALLDLDRISRAQAAEHIRQSER